MKLLSLTYIFKNGQSLCIRTQYAQCIFLHMLFRHLSEPQNFDFPFTLVILLTLFPCKSERQQLFPELLPQISPPLYLVLHFWMQILAPYAIRTTSFLEEVLTGLCFEWVIYSDLLLQFILSMSERTLIEINMCHSPTFSPNLQTPL